MTIRTFPVLADDADRPLADFLSDRLRLTRPAVERLVRAGQVRVAGTVCADPRRRLRPGEHVVVQLEPAGKPAPKKKQHRSTPGGPAVVHVDADLVVVDKPPGLTTMRHAHEAAEFGARGRRFLPPTLQDLLPDLLGGGRGQRVRAVHRIDNETSGLVVFALTPEAESNLGRQFRAHSTDRLYLALVRGRPREGRIESWLLPDRGDGRRGSGAPEEGQRAVTSVRVVEALGEYSLVECRLETGRTHQVRIHLGEAGAPLCGERVYDRPPHGRPAPDGSGATRVMLHAATLGFDHPGTGARVRWQAPLPADMAALLERLRAGQ
jgi:23S rRNA pseudouridine1911/1915/1917 synthase